MQFFDDGFELGFFAFREVEHFFGVVQEDCAFCFGLRDVDRAGEDADFGFFGLFDGAVGFAAEDHAFDDFGLGKRAAHDFHNADVVDVKVYGVFGEDGEDGLSDEGGEEVFATGLLGGDDCADGFAEFGLGSYVLDFVDDEFCARSVSTLCVPQWERHGGGHTI